MKKKLLLLLSIVPIFIVSQDAATVFAHGAFAHPGQAKHFKEAFSNPENFKSPKFDDNQVETSWNPISHMIAFLTKRKYPTVDYAPSHAYFGYEKDIEVVKESVESYNKPVVLFGACRGGIATINYLARQVLSNVKAVVIEGTPANIAEAYDDKLAKFGVPIFLSKRLFGLSWPAYSSNAKSTVESIKDIKNKELPILIIHSTEDTNFTFSNGLRLYKEFKEQGFSNVSIAPLKGIHMRSLREDKENYLRAVHSFYKGHGLPYKAEYATENLQNYSYNLEDAQKIIDQEKTDLQVLIRNRQLGVATMAAILGASYYVWKKYYSEPKVINEQVACELS